MRYLTDASESTDSPQLRRNSKVLSWIESGDMLFEDMGTGPRDGDDCKYCCLPQGSYSFINPES